jgi:serine/threonine-protein kinase
MSEAQKEEPQSGGTVVQDPNAGGTEAVATEGGQGSDLTGVTLLNRYKITKKLGEGGMGTVYLGEHTTIRKKFAIKVLAAEFAHKPDLVERFLQEARAASMIPQENVVEITDFGDTPDGSVFFVMEHLRGEDLSDTVKNEGALPWSRVKPIMLQVCSALQAAHDAGIIHRDMKPENCFRIKRGSNEDFIKVLDFGIAKVTSDEGEGGKGLTRTGMIFGTPEYMSPEQAQGQKADHRVDVYAAGVIMYELLTGRVPFTADTFMGILTKHMFDVPEAPSNINGENGITAEMEAIILKAMQKDRDLRFQNMDEMAEAISAVGTGAEAVAVVSEQIARPDAGEMAFIGGAAPAGTVAPQGTYPPQGGTYPPMIDGYQQRSKAPLAIGLLAVLGIAGAAGYYFGVAKPAADAEVQAKLEAERQAAAAEVAKANESAQKAAEAAAAAAAAKPPAQKQLNAAVPHVTMRIKTPVDAQILDAADGAIFGMTNSDKGVELEKSDEAIKLILRADGYEDLAFEVVPSRDKEFEKALDKKKKRTSKKKTKKASSASTSTPEPTKEPPKTTKKPTKKPKKPTKPGKGRGGSPDLKDPFG